MKCGELPTRSGPPAWLYSVLTSRRGKSLTYYELYNKMWDLCRSFGTTIERTWSGLIWLRIGASGGGGVLVNAVMKFRIPQNANNLLTDKEL